MTTPLPTDRGSEEVHLTHSPDETLEVAARLATSLPGGSVVLLRGDLGVGKTLFAKGLALGLGLDADRVVSPTYTLVHEHEALTPGGVTLVHVDLYRISVPADADELGLSELPGPSGIAAVEWPDRLGHRLVTGAVEVFIDDEGPTTRRITVRRPAPGSPAPERVLEA